MSFFLIHRGWRESGMFGKEQPFSDREKWLWLIENASFKDTTVSINRNPIKLKRGQLSYSRRYLANAWGVSERNVRTFLEHAKKWQAIELENDQGQIVITICNYSQYQDNRPQNDQPMTSKTTRDRPEGDPNKKQGINKYKTNKQEWVEKSKEEIALEMTEKHDDPEKRLYFNGHVIKLNRKDYEKFHQFFIDAWAWKMEQFDEWLDSRDDWLAENPMKSKNWYMSTLNAIKKEVGKND